jgi:signal transduction histidine kinase
MRAIGWLRRRPLEAAWVAFSAANVAAMIALPKWETIPFHFIWVSLTLLYGLRTWDLLPTFWTLGAVVLVTGALISDDAVSGTQGWGELFEVPLMSMMFGAMVWHARRRQAAATELEQVAGERAELLQRQRRFLDDASHELRTPVTIARGHLELLGLRSGGAPPEVAVAADELLRIERIVERLLLLVKAEQPEFLEEAPVDVESFLEDVFMRWSEIAPRVWRLGAVASGSVAADPDGLRIALDALIENAVKYTEPRDAIELVARAAGQRVVIEVRDGGSGIEAASLATIFGRFARADGARTRSRGGVGLGLAIVDTIAKAHGGSCSVRSSRAGSVFALSLPRFVATASPAPSPEPATIGS